MVPICLDVLFCFISCLVDEHRRAPFSVMQLSPESGHSGHWINTQWRHNGLVFFFPNDTSLCPRAPPLVFSQLPDENPSNLFEMRWTNTCGKHHSEENITSGCRSLESTRSCRQTSPRHVCVCACVCGYIPGFALGRADVSDCIHRRTSCLNYKRSLWIGQAGIRWAQMVTSPERGRGFFLWVFLKEQENSTRFIVFILKN